MNMHRREALRNVALLVGGGVVLSGTTMSMLFDSCKSPVRKAATLFTADQEKILAEIADIIIPATTCPGAKEAGIGPFIAMMIKDCYPETVQKDFIDGLKAFESDTKKQLNKAFLEATPKEKENMVAALRMKTIAQQKADKAQKNNTPEEAVPQQYKGNYVKTAARSAKKEKSYFFVLTRDLTIMGYFSSEIGATQARAYVAVPGRYDGCVELQPGQKAWA